MRRLSTSSSEGRRGRRALLLAVVALAVVEFGVARQDWVWDWNPRSQAGVIPALESAVIAGSRPTVVCMGSSRMRDAVAPVVLEQSLGLSRGEVLNLGVTSGTPVDALLLYRRNRETLSKATVIVFGVEDFFFNGNLPASDQVRRYLGLGDRARYFDLEPSIGLWVGWLYRTYDARGPLRGLLSSGLKRPTGKIPVGDDGRLVWRKRSAPYGPAQSDVSEQIRRVYKGWALSFGQWKALGDLRALAHADGVQLELVWIPWRSTYLPKVRELFPDAVDAWWAALDAQRPLLSADAAELGMTDRDFYDYGHLANHGAEVYSKALAGALRPALAAP